MKFLLQSFRPQPSPSIDSPSFQQRLKDLDFPRPDEIEGGKAFQGALAGVLVGTALSLGVSTVKASFVAGVVAAFFALVPILGGLDIEDELEDAGSELPGVSIAAVTTQTKEALQGDKAVTTQSAATVLAASISAGALVAIFAAKSLGIAVAGTAGFVALSKKEDVDIQKSTRKGRDYLRTRGYSGPGIATSLLLLQSFGVQAKQAALTISNAVQGRSTAFEESLSRKLPSEEGVYRVSRLSPATRSAAAASSSARPASTQQEAAAQPLKASTPSQPSAQQEPAGDLLEEALRLRKGLEQQASQPLDKAAVQETGVKRQKKVQAGNGAAQAAGDGDLLKQAMEYRRGGAPTPPDPQDPKDKQTKARAAPVELPEQESKPEGEENLLEEALRLRGSGAGSNGARASSSAPQKTKPAPTPSLPRQESPAAAEVSSGPSDNLLEEALRLRSQGSSQTPAKPSAPSPAKPSSGSSTFKGSRSDELIFKARDAVPSSTKGQQALRPSAEGRSNAGNLDSLGSKWKGSGSTLDKPSASDLQGKDDLIISAQQSIGAKPEGLGKLSIGRSQENTTGRQPNPAAGRGPSLGGPASKEPLKGALGRQQEQSQERIASQNGGPIEKETSTGGEDLLAEALRLRGQGSATPSPKNQPRQPAKAQAAKVEPAIEKPSDGEDLLAEALRLRSQQPVSATPAKAPGPAAVNKSQAKPTPGDPLIFAGKASAEVKRGASSGKQPNPAAGRDAGLGSALKGALGRQQEESKQRAASQNGASQDGGIPSGGEDLLAEALRLRGDSPATSTPKAPTKQPVRTQAVKPDPVTEEPAEGEDLLAEALRLRGQPVFDAKIVSPSSTKKTDKQPTQGRAASGDVKASTPTQQTNPAAGRDTGLWGALKGALGRQQEQSKERTGSQNGGSPAQRETSSDGEDLLAEALRLRGERPAASTPKSTPEQPAAAKASKQQPVLEKPAEGEDLLAEALRLRGQQTVSSTPAKTPSPAAPARAQNQPTKGSDAASATTGSASTQQTNPAAGRDTGLWGALKGALGRQQKQSKERVASQNGDSGPQQESPAAEEDLLAEALRLRSSGTPSPSSKAAPKQSVKTEAKTETPVVSPGGEEDLLAEALRLRGQTPVKMAPKPTPKQPAQASKAEAQPPQRQPTGGEDLLAEALRLRGGPASRSASKPALKQPAQASRAAPQSTQEQPAGGEDLLVEALRLRGERPQRAAASQTSSRTSAGKPSEQLLEAEGGDLLAEALRLRAEGSPASQAKRSDLATTTLDLEPSGDKPSQKGREPSTPLEKVKGGNRDVEAGDLASTPVEFTPSQKEPLLQGDSPAQRDARSTPETPLEKVKGGNKDVEAGDLASTPVEFTPSQGDSLLKGDSPAQRDARSTPETPLEKVKGGNKDVEAGDLASTPVEFTPSKRDPLLKGDSPAQKEAKSDKSETPLEKVKGGNRDVESGDLASTPVEFEPTDKEPLLKKDSPAQQDARSIYSTPMGKLPGYQGPSAPLENLKGGRRVVQAGELAGTPVAFTPSKGEPLLKYDSAAQQEARKTFSTPVGGGRGAGGGGGDIKQGKAGSVKLTPPGGTPLLQPDSPAQPGKEGGQTPLQRMKGKGTPFEPALSSNVPFRPGFKEGLLARTSQPESDVALGSTQTRSDAGAIQSSVLQLQTSGAGKVMSLKSFSSRAAGSAASTPFQSGQTAIQQDTPEMQPPARRSAARPNPALRVSNVAPADRPGYKGVSIPSLTRGAAGVSSVSFDVGRAGVPQIAPGGQKLESKEQLLATEAKAAYKGRTAVENWLLLAGTGLLGSLATLTWRLVQGLTVAEPVNKALMAAVMICMVVIVLLTTFARPKGTARPAAA